MRFLRSTTLRQIVLLAVLACLPGCLDERLEFTEVKNIHEKVTESELQTFLSIVNSLPDKTLPDFPPVFAPPVNWSRSRTLQVSSLVTEEENRIEEHWTVESIARHLEKNRHLQRAVRRAKITSEQFVGLTLAIGVAVSRTTLREDQDLDALLIEGNPYLKQLSQDGRKFDDLSAEAAHNVLRDAVWITRRDRARALRLVPPENIALVHPHLSDLSLILPGYLTTNPLDAVADLLKERGMPFEELSEDEGDEALTWDPQDKNAKVGSDAPDREFSKQNSSKAAQNELPAQI